MKRLLIIILLAIVGLATFIFFRVTSVQNVPVASNPQEPVPVSPINANAGILYLGDFKNASTGIAISFKYIPDPSHPRNATDGVYIDQEKIGEVSGSTVFVVGYSPSNNYFALKTMSALGASDRDYEVYVIDVKGARLLNLRPRVDSPAYPSKQFKPIDLYKYVDWVAWSGDHSIDIRSYLLWPDYNDASNTITYYRVSPEETWRHDLITGSSTLIETIP